MEKKYINAIPPPPPNKTSIWKLELTVHLPPSLQRGRFLRNSFQKMLTDKELCGEIKTWTSKQAFSFEDCTWFGSLNAVSGRFFFFFYPPKYIICSAGCGREGGERNTFSLKPPKQAMLKSAQPVLDFKFWLRILSSLMESPCYN